MKKGPKGLQCVTNRYALGHTGYTLSFHLLRLEIKSSIVAERFLKGTKMEPKYKPLYERTPDYQYQNCLRMVLEKGRLTQNPAQTTGTYTSLRTPKMIFELSNGVPLITERKIPFWKVPIAEITAFINGVRDGDELVNWGVNWWRKDWATKEKCADFGLEDGDLGPGSYGAAFHDFPTSDGGTFNQFEHLIKGIKERPAMRTHKITPWIPQLCLQHSGLQRKVVVAPCHGDILVTIINDKLSLQMVQRSADVPIGLPANLIQYAALTIMIAHVTEFEPFEFIHIPQDAQIYTNQVPWVMEILERKPRPFPTLHLTEEGQQVTNLFDFRARHFELREYDPHPAIKDIPVTT